MNRVYILALYFLILIKASSAVDLPKTLQSALASPKIAQSTEIRSVHVDSDGDITYMSMAEEGLLKGSGSTLTPTELGRLVLEELDLALGIGGEGEEWKVRAEVNSLGATTVKYSQQIDEIPVFGASIIVGTRNNGVFCLLNDSMKTRNGPIRKSLLVSASEAEDVAAEDFAAQSGNHQPVLTAEAQLIFFSPQILGISGIDTLCWHVILDDPTNSGAETEYFVATDTGAIKFRLPRMVEAQERRIYDAANSCVPPGTLVRRENGNPTGIADVDNAYDHLESTYKFYSDVHGRDSIDDYGYTLSATTRLCRKIWHFCICPYPNAFWDGKRMYFGEGFTTDDVVAHEYTHGVTQLNSGLIYFGESGAINESFSDIWGEFVDLTAANESDLPEHRWLMGEDIPDREPVRNMKDPTVFGHADSTCSPYWYQGSGDRGGVHYNSGVSNKLCYLLTDGGEFDGYSVQGMGIEKVAKLFYEAQTQFLNPGANYLELYACLMEAARFLHYSEGDIQNLAEACHAVRITPDTRCNQALIELNDDCSHPNSAIAGIEYVGNTENATESVELNCRGVELQDSKDVWFSFIPDVSAGFTVSLCGSDFDTTLAVYEGPCDSLALLNCNDDYCGAQSQLTLTLEEGKQYLIRIGGFNGDFGNFSFSVNATVTPPGEALVEKNVYIGETSDLFEDKGARIISLNTLTGSRDVVTGPIMVRPTFLVPDVSTNSLYATDLGTSDSGSLRDHALWRVSSSSGVELVSGLGRGDGPLLLRIGGVAVDGNGALYLVDTGGESILTVDPVTGDRAVFSGVERGGGVPFEEPFQIILHSDGFLYVTDGGIPGLVRVDPVSGGRSIVSHDNLDPRFRSPRGLCAENDNHLLVVDSSLGAVIRVELQTGKRTFFTSNDTELFSGPPLDFPQFIIPHGAGYLLTDLDTQILLHVNSSGTRTVFSGEYSGTEFGTGISFQEPQAVAIYEGNAVVADSGLGGIIQVLSEQSNVRILLPYSQRGEGPLLQVPAAIALGAPGELLIADSALEAVFSVDITSGNRRLISGGDPIIGQGQPFGSENPRDIATAERVSDTENGEVAFQMAMAADSDNNVLWELNLTSGERRVAYEGPDVSAVDFGNAEEVYVLDNSAKKLLLLNLGDPNSGPKIVSDNIGSSGPSFDNILDVKYTPGNLYILDRDKDAIFNVDPESGMRSILSGDPNGFNVGTGPDFQQPLSLGADSVRYLYVADTGLDGVVRVDSDTGNRTMISGFDTNVNIRRGHGPELYQPGGLYVEEAVVVAGSSQNDVSLTCTGGGRKFSKTLCLFQVHDSQEANH